MNTIERLQELLDTRCLTLYQLAGLSNIPYSTLKKARQSGRQLSVDTIEQICLGLGITMSEFFYTDRGNSSGSGSCNSLSD